MTFDLLSTVGLTASAAVVVATYVALFGSALTQRVTIGAAMALWFIGVLWIGVPGNISTPLLGAAVLIPVAVFSVIGFGSFASRSWLQSAPLPALIALNAIRVIGVLFVLLLPTNGYRRHSLRSPAGVISLLVRRPSRSRFG